MLHTTNGSPVNGTATVERTALKLPADFCRTVVGQSLGLESVLAFGVKRDGLSSQEPVLLVQVTRHKVPVTRILPGRFNFAALVHDLWTPGVKTTALRRIERRRDITG